MTMTADPQLSLAVLDEFQNELVVAGDELHRHSGVLLKTKNPRLYEAIVTLLGCDVPVDIIARRLSVSNKTVMGIECVEAERVTDFSKTISTTLKRFAFTGSRRMLREAADMDIDKLPFAVQAATATAAQLDGAPTQVIEHRHTVQLPVVPEALSKALAGLGFAAGKWPATSPLAADAQGGVERDVSPPPTVIEAQVSQSGGDSPPAKSSQILQIQ